MRKPFQRIPFFIRFFNWEYWPFNVVYLPVFGYVGWLSLRARSPLFFTAANPGIPTGGLVGESKLDILNMLPAEWKPATLFIPESFLPEQCNRALVDSGIIFPLVAKPDIGERGLLVKVIYSQEQLAQYRKKHPVDFLLQEFIDYPEEISVLYFRFPGQESGRISSVTLKQYLSVAGNGRDTLEKLIEDYPRARLQRETLKQSHAAQWHDIPAEGEIVRFHTIGNHSKGCMFLDGRHKISDQLVRTFDRINSRLDGVCYCRYDIKCASWESMEQGRDFRILEINGVKSEPAHIYDPDYPIPHFYRDIFWHWKVIFHISQANRRAGVAYMRVSEALVRLKNLWQYHRRITQKTVLTAAFALVLLSACSGETVRQGREEGKLRDGVRHGTWTGYHFNEQAAWKGHFRQGKPDGEWNTWLEDGTLHETYSFRNGLREGRYRAMYPDGQIREDGEYRSGEKSGLWTRYFPDGKIQETGTYTEGKKQGQFRSFYGNGRTESQFSYIAGDGEGAGFHANGEISYTGQWLQGKQQGLWRYFDEGGKLLREEFYHNGQLISSN